MAQLAEKPQTTGTDVATLLLVDDDPNHREIYQRRLERRGYRVRLAESADEAVAAMREGAPSAVVLDIAMPARDGLSALQEMIALQPDLPVIIHSSYPAFRDDFVAWMADAYVEKSCDLEPLLIALQRALSPPAT